MPLRLKPVSIEAALDMREAASELRKLLPSLVDTCSELRRAARAATDDDGDTQRQQQQLTALQVQQHRRCTPAAACPPLAAAALESMTLE